MEDYKYTAFISYKREDEASANWLQKELEKYRFNSSIRRMYPGLPKKVGYICRDTTDFSGGVLEKTIKNALCSSKFLIVICSPLAAKSPWVCKEVQEFIDLGKEEFIIPFIIDGEANSHDIQKECFPKSLKSLSGSRELLGININDDVGRDAAVIKVVARIFNLHFTTIWQRIQREESKRRKKIIIVLFSIIACITGVAIWLLSLNIEVNRQKQIISDNQKQLKTQLEISKRQRDSLQSLSIELSEKNESLKHMISTVKTQTQELSIHKNEINMQKEKVQKLSLKLESSEQDKKMLLAKIEEIKKDRLSDMKQEHKVQNLTDKKQKLFGL